MVTIKEKNPDAKIYYTTDGSRPTLQSAVYSGPIAVSKSETIKVLATGEHTNASGVATETFKIKHGGNACGFRWGLHAILRWVPFT